MTKEAMTLALEALEDSIDTVRHEYETDWRHGMPTRLVQLERMKIGVENHERAIIAIKEALAQPEQEPVAWRFQSAVGGWAYDKEPPIGSKYAVEPLYTTPYVATPRPQRKPLTYVDLRRIANQCGLGANEVSARTHATIDNFARAIEAAHGIIKE